MALARAEVWARARALDASASGVARGPRARDLARRLRSPLTGVGFDDVAEAPAWTAWPLDRRKRLARVAGAVMSAQRLQQVIDGRVLGPVGVAVGATALDAVLDIPRHQTFDIRWPGDLTPTHLEGLGTGVLLQDLPPMLRQRLSIGLTEPTACLAPDEAAAVVALALRIEAAE